MRPLITVSKAGFNTAKVVIEEYIKTGIDVVLEASATFCGNSVVEGNEQCDDGNTASGDGCSSTCQSE